MSNFTAKLKTPTAAITQDEFEDLTHRVTNATGEFLQSRGDFDSWVDLSNLAKADRTNTFDVIEPLVARVIDQQLGTKYSQQPEFPEAVQNWLMTDQGQKFGLNLQSYAKEALKIEHTVAYPMTPQAAEDIVAKVTHMMLIPAGVTRTEAFTRAMSHLKNPNEVIAALTEAFVMDHLPVDPDNEFSRVARANKAEILGALTADIGEKAVGQVVRGIEREIGQTFVRNAPEHAASVNQRAL